MQQTVKTLCCLTISAARADPGHKPQYGFNVTAFEGNAFVNPSSAHRLSLTNHDYPGQNFEDEQQCLNFGDKTPEVQANIQETCNALVGEAKDAVDAAKNISGEKHGLYRWAQKNPKRFSKYVTIEQAEDCIATWVVYEGALREYGDALVETTNAYEKYYAAAFGIYGDDDQVKQIKEDLDVSREADNWFVMSETKIAEILENKNEAEAFIKEKLHDDGARRFRI